MNRPSGRVTMICNVHKVPMYIGSSTLPIDHSALFHCLFDKGATHNLCNKFTLRRMPEYDCFFSFFNHLSLLFFQSCCDKTQFNLVLDVFSTMPFGIWDPKSSRSSDADLKLNGTELLIDEGHVDIGSNNAADTHVLKRVVYRVRQIAAVGKIPVL